MSYGNKKSFVTGTWFDQGRLTYFINKTFNSYDPIQILRHKAKSEAQMKRLIFKLYFGESQRENKVNLFITLCCERARARAYIYVYVYKLCI